MDRLFDLLLVSDLKGIGKKTIHKKYLEAIRRSKDTEDLVSNYLPRIKAIPKADINNSIERVKTSMEEIRDASDVEVITCLSNRYPKKLLKLGDSAPLILYARGNLEALGSNSVAVVGTRKPSPHSEKVERNLVSKIIELDGTKAIVSGLAIGCDEIAHRTALQNNGITVAVLPSGVKNIVPAKNRELAEEIVSQNGCLVSEYPINTDATRWSFVERDGLIAALADATVVMECGINSGTMHTVRKASELQKPIACYWPIDFAKGSYEGNAYMIEKMGAKPLGNTEALKRLLML